MFYSEKLSINNDVFTYGQGVEFASIMFKFLNGRINPNLPARYLLIGKIGNSDPLDTGVVGDNIGDIVQLDIDGIMRTSMMNTSEMTRKEKSDRFKGLILYCLIHEILHIEQNMATYYKFGFDEETTTTLIEESCHCATSYIFNQLVQSNILQIEFDPPITFEIPSLTNFILWSNEKDSYDRILQAYHSYYRIGNPYEKVMWLLNSFLSPDPILDDASILYDYVEKGYSSILLNVVINEKICQTGYLLYLNYLQPPLEIMKTIDFMVFMQKQGMKDIYIKHLTNPNFPELIVINVEYQGDNRFLEIVKQIPSNEFPIPPIM